MKIAILGYGKMGKAIERIALDRGHEVMLRIDENNRELVTDDALKDADVAIEFSSPMAAVENYRWCFRAGIPVVSGTTGWLKQWDEVITFCKECNGGFFYASNFSIGVNVFFHLNTLLAKMMARLDTYQASIEEIHHVHKLDAPSGTAITLAAEIVRENPVYNSWCLSSAEQEKGKLPIYAKREGEVPGTHIVVYKSSVDEIQIRHEAYSREGFARGAVLAAEFMKGKQGVYGMENLLTLDN